MIILVTGWARSGKDSLAGILRDKYGFVHFDFYRDILMEEVKRRGLEVSKDNASKTAIEMRQVSGNNGIMGKLMGEKIALEKNPNIVVTGGRSPEEVTELEKTGQKVLLIAVDADAEKRFQRRLPNDPNTFEGFLERDKRDDARSRMGEIVNAAKIRLENNGSEEEFKEKITELLKELLKKN